MKEFKKFYVLAMNAKLFMAIYFVAMVFLAGIVIAISGGNSISLLVLVEMLLVCAVIAVLQCVFLDDKTDYGKGIFFGRSVLWIVISTALTVGAALLFSWFDALMAWCPYLLGAFMLFALTAMLFGLKFEQDADTVRLNKDLDKFKEQH